MSEDINSSELFLGGAGRIMSDESEQYTLSIGSQATDQDIESTESSISSIDCELEELMEQVVNTLPTNGLQFEEAIIKENLEEVLLMLIALHGETHGKELLTDLTHHFDVQLSPGTVYPCLHELEEEELLAMHAMVRTKEYSIEDEDAARATIERTMVQHLAFGLLLYAFLPRL
ncbi:helix-turn-helix transcriptional regulator [Natronorubrum sp. FCH18a]|uniref:helix-turn-helix transcriptional regulator n=1 Tax=Natronorubrum sp. FCH18a TaxID=3447018 RepID=UPI003F5156D2